MLRTALSDINLSFDMCTSSNNLQFLAITASFIDKNGKLQHLPLDLHHIQGSKTAAKQSDVILKVLNEYKIRDKARYFISDNASDNTASTRLICDQILPDSDSKHHRLRCTGHILNLVASAILDSSTLSQMDQDALESETAMESSLWEQGGPIMKLQTLGVYLARSPQRRERFLDSQMLDKAADDRRKDEAAPLRTLNLPHAGGVRWNSVYAMIERGLKLKPFINDFIGNEIGSFNYSAAAAITANEWTDLRSYQEILKPLLVLTKRTEGIARDGSHGALWEVIAVQQHLFDELQRLEDAADPGSAAVQGEFNMLLIGPSSSFTNSLPAIQRGRAKLREYWEYLGDSPAYLASVVLNPKLGWRWIEHKWLNHKPWITSGKAEMKKLWEIQKKRASQEASEQGK